MPVLRASLRFFLAAVLIAGIAACSSDGSDPDPAAPTPSARPTPSEACRSTAEAVLQALRAVVGDHREMTPQRFVRRYGGSPSLASQLDIAGDDIKCDQPTSFALAVEQAGDISQETSGALLAKGLLLAEMGSRLSYGQDIGPLTPVVAPLPVDPPPAPTREEIDDAGSCSDLVSAHTAVFQTTLDAIAGLTLEQFFGVEPGAEEVQEDSLGVLEAVEPALERLGCDEEPYFRALVAQMTTLETRGFTDNAALGSFVRDVYSQLAADG